MIEEEFGAKPGPTWRGVLRTNRVQWRRHQTGAAVSVAMEKSPLVAM